MLLHNPSFPDVSQEVPDDDTAEWIESGWREDPTPAPVPDVATPPADSEADAAPDTIEPSTLTGDDQAAPDNSEVPAETQE